MAPQENLAYWALMQAPFTISAPTKKKFPLASTWFLYIFLQYFYLLFEKTN